MSQASNYWKAEAERLRGYLDGYLTIRAKVTATLDSLEREINEITKAIEAAERAEAANRAIDSIDLSAADYMGLPRDKWPDSLSQTFKNGYGIVSGSYGSSLRLAQRWIDNGRRVLTPQEIHAFITSYHKESENEH